MHKDPFSLFSLPISVFVNEANLSERYQEMQRDLHPDQFYDRFMKKSAEQLSAYANQAYQRLLSPLKCAEEAIKAKSWQVPDADQTLLVEMMELQDMVKSGEDIRPFYQDCLLQLEIALQEDREEKATTSYSRLKFIARLLGYS